MTPPWGKWLVLTLLIGVSLTQRVKDDKDYGDDYINDDGRYQEFSAGKGGKFLISTLALGSVFLLHNLKLIKNVY